MRGNAVSFKRIISSLVAVLLILLLLLPTAGVAEGINRGQTRQSYLDQFSDDGKQIILTAVSKMSPSEIQRLLENLEKTVSAEDLEEYKGWLTDNGIALPVESVETDEAQGEYAAVSAMSDAEKQAYIQRLNEMSEEEIVEYMQNLNCDLLPEQMVEFNGWFEKYGFNNPNLTEESFAGENDLNSEYMVVSAMNDAEKQAYIHQLNEMSKEDITEYFMILNCELLPDQMEEFNGWLEKYNFNNPNLTEESGSYFAAEDDQSSEEAAVSKSSDAETQTYIKRLNEMSKEEINQFLDKLDQELSEEQLIAFEDWLVSNGFNNPHLLDETFEETGEAQSEDEAASKSIEAETQEYIKRLNEMPQEEIVGFFKKLDEELSQEQVIAFEGWLVSNGFNNPHMMFENPEGNNEAQGEFAAVAEMSDAEKQEYIQQLNEMSKEEITEYFRTLNYELEPEQMTEFNGWLEKYGFHNPNLTEESGSQFAVASGDETLGETDEAQGEFAAVAEMSDAEKQAYIQRLNEMSEEEITEYFRTLNYGLEPEQMTEFNGWLEKYGFHNPNLTEESGSQFAVAEEPEDVIAQITLMSDTEKQAYIERLNKMAQEVVDEYLLKIVDSLETEDLISFSGWLVSNGFDNSGIPEAILAEAEEGEAYLAEAEGAVASGSEENGGVPNLADFAKMNNDEQLTFLEKLTDMSPDELNAVMCQSAEGLTEEMKETLIGWIVENNDLSTLDMDNWFSGNTDAAAPNLSDFAKMNEEKQLAFLEKLIDMSPEDLNAVMCQSAEGLTEEQKEALIGWIVMNNDLSNLDLDNWFSGISTIELAETAEASGDEKETSYFAQLTDEEKQQTLNEVSKMTPEEIGALIGSLQSQVSSKDLQEYIDWLTQNGIAVPADIAVTEEVNGESMQDADLAEYTPVENASNTIAAAVDETAEIETTNAEQEALAEEAGDSAEPNAQELYELAQKYKSGDGVDQDPAKAAEYCQKAAELGLAEAQYTLAMLYMFGEGVEEDYEKAAEWMEMAAAQGFVAALYKLGSLYLQGWGVAQDSEKALMCYTQAAAQGHSGAMFTLGMLYYFGDGVDKNLETAAEWFTKGAQAGDSQSLYFMGKMYESGEGVEQNKEKAIEFYQQAADQGYQYAIDALDNLQK